MANEHAFTLTFEASGEVTPAPQHEDVTPDNETTKPEPATEPEPEEAEQ